MPSASPGYIGWTAGYLLAGSCWDGDRKRAFEDDASGCIDGLSSDCRIGAVDQDLNLRRRASLKVARIIVRNAESDAGVTGAYIFIYLTRGKGVCIDGKDVGGGEAPDQFAALLGMRFVQNKGWKLADVGVYGEAKE